MQAALYEVSEAAQSADDLLRLFQRIHQIVGSLLPAVNFCVALYDDKTDALTFPYCVDEYDHTPPTQKLDSTLLSAEVVRTGEVVLQTPDTVMFPSDNVLSQESRDSLSLLGVPLITKKRVIGALVLKSYCAEVSYTKKDIELLQFVSAQIATAIERKQMEIWLQHIARHDPLTNLPNRELFHASLQTALLLAKRNQTQLFLLYIDLDKFKEINDSLGHTAGDFILQEVARRLQMCVRESDTVGRVGGDEFLVLLNNTPLLEHALLVAENIRAVLSLAFDLGGHQVHISPSIGAAAYPEHGGDYEQLIQSADEAMYGAKRSGGNRVWLTSAPGMLHK